MSDLVLYETQGYSDLFLSRKQKLVKKDLKVEDDEILDLF